MRRFASAMLAGLGLLCVIAAAALAWLIVPDFRQVPYDLTPPNIVVVADNATFVRAGVGPNGVPEVAVQHGALRSTTGIKPDVKAAAELTGELAGKTIIWNVYQATDQVDKDVPVNRAESRIALDRASGAAVAWKGQCYNDVKVTTQGASTCEPGSIQFTGQFLLFPFGTEKRTYQYFDSSVRRSLPIEYKGTDDVAGLQTYRFEQTVPQQDLAVDQETVSGLLGFLAPTAKTATMNYSASRTLWVEPLTGSILAYRDHQSRELVPDIGPAVTILDATFQYDKATAATVLDQTKQGRSRLLLFGRYLPIGLLVVGILAIVSGLLVTRRKPTPGAHTAQRIPEPEPSAVPQG